MPVRFVVGVGWLLFFAYWWISAIGVKKNVRRRSLRWEVGVRLGENGDSRFPPFSLYEIPVRCR
jgi:hypothetical protein